MSGPRKKEGMTFEKAMARLETIVEAMEGEEVPIEDALKHFEEGMALVAFCEQKLNEVQKKVELILEKKGGAPKEAPEDYTADGE